MKVRIIELSQTRLDVADADLPQLIAILSRAQGVQIDYSKDYTYSYIRELNPLGIEIKYYNDAPQAEEKDQADEPS